jgi:allantoinase
MSLPADYLSYPMRRYGMDHDWYRWRSHPATTSAVWPNGAKVAVWICVSIEFFPLNPSGKPLRAPGSMVTPYPDLRHYTTRDYGNRVAVHRLLRLFRELGITASFAVNSAVAVRYPYLIGELVSAGHEIIAHGVDMDRLHHEGLGPQEESALIDESLTTLESLSGRRPSGWLSPARLESSRTPALLAARGLSYFCDFANDELPYDFMTESGPLIAMPLSHELSDRQLLIDYHHSDDEYVEQVLAQYDRLLLETDAGGCRALSLPLTPYITGLPYRIGALRRLLDALRQRPGAWFATGDALLDAWVACTKENRRSR